MASPPARRLAELIALLRETGWDPTAEEIADALWLAQWVTPAGPRDGAGRRPLDDSGGAERPPGTDNGRTPRPHPPQSGARVPGGREDPAAGPVLVHLYAGATAADRGGGALPVRAPAATALPGVLRLQRALRPLQRYRPPRPAVLDGLDEEATADRSARTGELVPVYRRIERRDAGMQLLMDASPSMVVWERMLAEFRQVCERLGAFREVQVHYLHRGDDGTPLIGTAPGPGGKAPDRLRPADQFRDPTGRRLTLLVSDCVGPLWREGRAQRLLHHWAVGAPIAVLQPLPQRLWPRTALPAEPGLLVRDSAPGARIAFHPTGYGPARAPGPRALPVPVLLPSWEALGSWARLLSGAGDVTVRGAAGWVLADHPVVAPSPVAGTVRGADELIETFRASASAGAWRLVGYLAAAPLSLPVMQLVQRAMLPDTGPTELAEVLLGGLLLRRPDPVGGEEAGPWYEFAPGVADQLLQELGRDEAALVLKHCSEFVAQHFGRGARNFPALAVAQLSGRAAPLPPGWPAEPEAPEPEPFAEVPARVVRRFQPLPYPVGDPHPVEEAERLLETYRGDGDVRWLLEAVRLLRSAAAEASGGEASGGEREFTALAEALLLLWRAQADPAQLLEARTAAEQAVARTGREPDRDRHGRVAALLTLGRVLRAQAAPSAARRDALEWLREAVACFQEARSLTRPAADRPEGDSSQGAGSDPARYWDATLELAGAAESLWRLTGDPSDLEAVESALGEPPTPSDPQTVLARHLQRGRILLALAGAGHEPGPRAAEAARELRAAQALLAAGSGPAATTGTARPAPDSRRCLALLDLAEALRLVGGRREELVSVLAEADAAAAGDDGLRLRCLIARARARAAFGDWQSAADAYAAAVPLTRRYTSQRSALLAEWGELRLRLAETDSGSQSVMGAVEVLRGAVAETPSSDPLTGRLQLLLGRAIALRFERGRYLPDLHEAAHLLGLAARRAEGAAVRAEAWLELAGVQVALHEQAPAVRLEDALLSYSDAVVAGRLAAAEPGGETGGETGGEAMGERMGDGPGSVLVARALHRRGALLERMEQPAEALESYRAAAGEWQRLTGRLQPVPWDEVDATRSRIRALEGR